MFRTLSVFLIFIKTTFRRYGLPVSIGPKNMGYVPEDEVQSPKRGF
jgi:hypothetical protein